MKMVWVGAAILVAVVAGVWSVLPQEPPFPPPATVSVSAGKVQWRPLGNFSDSDRARTPLPSSLDVLPFEIMKFQVSAGQYAVCVDEGACEPVQAPGGDVAQTQVSWYEATAFAEWYSRRSGRNWRLPTGPEWQRAAGKRFGDAASDHEAYDPGERMLASYERGIFLRTGADPVLRPTGAFGENALGLADVSGNVWEWTDTCMENGTIGPDGRAETIEPYCGVRIVGGLHRAAVIDFVRDASVGGCAVGLPPDHLGFRLVREP